MNYSKYVCLILNVLALHLRDLKCFYVLLKKISDSAKDRL